MDSIVDSKITDGSGLKRDGLVYGAPMATSSPLGGGVQFNGVDDYIELPLDLSWDENNKIAISFWVKPSSTGIDRYGIIGKKGSGWEWSIYQNYSNLAFVYWSTAGGHTNGMDANWASGVLSVNKWTHVVYVWDSQKSYFYADGVLVNTKVADNPAINQDRASNITLGGNIYTWAVRYWPGAIDDVRIYDRALSASEVKNLYQLGAINKNVMNVTPSGNRYNDGLVGHWTFDGKNLTTATATDSSGFGNHGTLVGNPRPTIGKVGQGLRFSNNYVFSNNHQIDITNKSFTIVSWIKPNLSPPSSQTFFTLREENTTRKNIHLRLYDTGSLRFGFFGDDLNSSAGVITFGQWNHVVMNYDFGLDKSRIYVNGLEVKNGSNGPFEGINPLLGIGSWITGEYFSGIIDDVRIYNRALSAQEIKDLYNATKGSKIKAQ